MAARLRLGAFGFFQIVLSLFQLRVGFLQPSVQAFFLFRNFLELVPRFFELGLKLIDLVL